MPSGRGSRVTIIFYNLKGEETMALAKKCDRCKKLYEHYPIGDQPGIFNAILLERRGPTGSVQCALASLDLCPDCMDLFDKFMKNVNEGE